MNFDVTSFLIGAIGAAGVVGYLIRSAIDKKIQHHYNKLLEKEKSNLEILNTILSNFIPAAINFPKLIIAPRNTCRCVLENKSFDENKANQLSREIEELETELYKYQLLIDKEVYRQIHAYKQEKLRKFMKLYLQIPEVQSQLPAKKFEELQSIYYEIDSMRGSTINMFSEWLNGLETFKRLKRVENDS